MRISDWSSDVCSSDLDLSDIEIVAPKELVPVMSALATVVSTNVLTADAVASALVLDAPIVVSTRSELLERAATLAGVPTRHVARGDCRHRCARAHSQTGRASWRESWCRYG